MNEQTNYPTLEQLAQEWKNAAIELRAVISNGTPTQQNQAKKRLATLGSIDIKNAESLRGQEKLLLKAFQRWEMNNKQEDHAALGRN